MALRFYGASDFPPWQGRNNFNRSPLALAGSSLFVVGHLFLGCAQYAAGSKKVRFPALSNEIFEMSDVNMIRPTQSSEEIESPSPPALKSDRIKIRVKDPPARFYQIVDSLFGRHFRPLFLNLA